MLLFIKPWLPIGRIEFDSVVDMNGQDVQDVRGIYPQFIRGSNNSSELEIGGSSSGPMSSIVLYGSESANPAEISIKTANAGVSDYVEVINVVKGDSPAVTLPCGKIGFPATQAPSSDANTLDDYEEGAWSPALKFGGASVGMTYSIQSGRYTKIGNVVTATGYLTLTAKGSSSGNATIEGLPFAAMNDNGALSAANVRISDVTYTGVVSAYVNKNTTVLYLSQTIEAGTASFLTQANFANSSSIVFSVTYLAPT